MSRHLAFWKYEKGEYLDNQEVYEKACCNEEQMEGLEKLPLSDIIKKTDDEFSNWTKSEGRAYSKGDCDFFISGTDQAVLFDCSWSMSDDDLNKIIDVMLAFGCRLYDPQITTRFDGSQFDV